MPTKPPDEELNPTSLAAAAYDLWQEQWQLLRTDPALVQDMQNFMEQFGQTMATALANASPTGAWSAAKGGSDAAANRTAAAAGNPSKQQSGAKPAAVASGAQQPDLAELAAAVAALTAKVSDLEAKLADVRLVAEPAATRSKTRRPKRQTPA